MLSWRSCPQRNAGESLVSYLSSGDYKIAPPFLDDKDLIYAGPVGTQPKSTTRVNNEKAKI